MTAKGKQRQEKSVREVLPVPLEDYHLIREEAEDGTITYRHPAGGAADVQEEEIDMLVASMHERYQRLIALLDREDYERFGVLFDALFAYNRQQMHEILTFITRAIGRIEVHSIYYKDDFYRVGRVVGISIEPPPSCGERKEVQP